MNATVRVTGLRETLRALRKLEGGLDKELRDELKKAAEPVAATARSLVSRYQGVKITTIKPVTTGSAVHVRQHARKVTGKRGDFGRLQQMNAFDPALAQHEDEIVSQVEEAFDRFAASAGF